MRDFWDAAAREDALFYVDDRVDYGAADVDAFFAGGEEVVAGFEEHLGFRAEARRLVEIGCGVGRLTRVLARRAGEVIALDVSGEMLTRARRLNPGLENVRWEQGDGTTLAGVPDAWADGVFSHVVFQHIPDPAITLGYVREMGRVLAPGGWAAFQVSDDPGVHRARDGLLTRLRAKLGRAPHGRRHPAWLGSAVPVSDVAAVAASAEMTVEAMFGPGTQHCLVLLRKAALPQSGDLP
jgi:SAM-dependent methyltransferase